jgi:cyclopropane fatty-acyl-phospholipid synthase-like methyltransferase
MEINFELISTIIIGVVGLALTVVQFIRERKKDKLETEQLLCDLQKDLTTGEAYKILSKQNVDAIYAILTYERAINKFMLLKKIAKQNSPAIGSIYRTLKNIENLIPSEYKEENNSDDFSAIYMVSHHNLEHTINRIKKKVSISDFYTKKYSEIAITQAIMGKRLIEMLNFNGVQKVLDFGCGDGRDAFVIACKYPIVQVDGFDASTELIQSAIEMKKRFNISNVHFWSEDANNFDKKNVYDIILSNFVIHWTGKQSFKIIYRALKNGGKFVASISGKGGSAVEETAWKKIQELGYSKYFEKSKDGKWKDKNYIPDQSTVEMELRNAGFTEIKATTEKCNVFDLKTNKSLKEIFNAEINMALPYYEEMRIAENRKKPKEIYEAVMTTTLPKYYEKLHDDEERKNLKNSVLLCLIEENKPIIYEDIVIEAKK